MSATPWKRATPDGHLIFECASELLDGAYIGEIATGSHSMLSIVQREQARQ
jgi:hypothetical protein